AKRLRSAAYDAASASLPSLALVDGGLKPAATLARFGALHLDVTLTEPLSTNHFHSLFPRSGQDNTRRATGSQTDRHHRGCGRGRSSARAILPRRPALSRTAIGSLRWAALP